MSVYVTINEAAESPPALQPVNKNVRLHFNEVDAGQVSGPFTADQAAQFATAAIAAGNAIKAVVEDVV